MRRPLGERWDKGALGLVGGVPWRVNDDDPKADGEAMKMDTPSKARQATELEKEVMAQAPIPRNSHIAKEHLTTLHDFLQHFFCKIICLSRLGRCPLASFVFLFFSF